MNQSSESEPERVARGRASPAEQRRRLESAIMRLLLLEEPGQFTIEELGREVARLAPSEPALRAAVDRLQRAGLVHRRGDIAILSRAARYLHRLRVY